LQFLLLECGGLAVPASTIIAFRVLVRRAVISLAGTVGPGIRLPRNAASTFESLVLAALVANSWTGNYLCKTATRDSLTSGTATSSTNCLGEIEARGPLSS
jgi:hypothetical protein